MVDGFETGLVDETLVLGGRETGVIQRITAVITHCLSMLRAFSTEQKN
jgi:hypothetical protein